MYVPLVRKWGVRSFDDVIGQPIVVKILKNSLFLDTIFSVYLFSGKHGCGKTSTARLFSAALNCEKVEDFRKNPTGTFPCFRCNSCIAMEKMQHPDFVELDAASHTGVDNVRILIESATLLPSAGRRKIYLIDEAHMLSKAACNALLKILEEPPRHVVFILATTAPEKILETVRSRSFQLLFHAISATTLQEYITKIASKEQIRFSQSGIAAIVNLGGGSVRDTVNMLDQARLAVQEITDASVQEVFGGIQDAAVLELLKRIFTGKQDAACQLIRSLCKDNEKQSVLTLFEKLILITHDFLCFFYGYSAKSGMQAHVDQFKDLQQQVTVQEAIALLSFLYAQEVTLRRVERAALFLEVILLEFLGKSSIKQKKEPEIQQKESDVIQEKLSEEPVVFVPQEPNTELPALSVEEKKDTIVSPWSSFLTLIRSKEDPLLSSMFSQAERTNYDEVRHEVTVVFKKELAFFTDLIHENKNDWQEYLNTAFGCPVTLQLQFIAIQNTEKKDEQKQNVEAKEVKASVVSQEKTIVEKTQKQNLVVSSGQKTSFYVSKNRYSKPKVFDISDAKKWPYAQQLQKIFPGVITEVEK